MHVSRQMLQEEAHHLVNSWVFDQLIIIHNEHEGGGRGRAPFQFLEQRCEDGGKRRRLGRGEQRPPGFPQARPAPPPPSQGPRQGNPQAGRPICPPPPPQPHPPTRPPPHPPST